MSISFEWLKHQPNTLHCHFDENWTISDVQEFVDTYQTYTANQVASFDMIITADSGPYKLPNYTINLPIHPAQQALIIVNAHTFYADLVSILYIDASTCSTIFAGSWTEACHLVAA